MSKIDDGGPAFPPSIASDQVDVYHGYSGMTLRDYFAAQVIPQLIAALDPKDRRQLAYGPGDSRFLSQSAYRMADAMLAERKKGGAS